jgi:hypothetical protein
MGATKRPGDADGAVLEAAFIAAKAELAQHLVDEKLQWKSGELQNLGGPLGIAVASVLTADASRRLEAQSRVLVKLTVALVVESAVLAVLTALLIWRTFE